MTIDNIRFASTKEGRRYSELKLLEKAGEITELIVQPRFALTVKGVVLGTYVGDFQYRERMDLISLWDRQGTATVVEDVKGMKTPLYRWKAKHLLAEYGFAIRET